MNTAVAQDEQIKIEVTHAVAHFMKTFNAQDVDAIVDLYTDDCIVVAPGQDPVMGKEALRAFWYQTINVIGMKDIDYTILDIQPMGPDYAGEVTRFSGTLGGVKRTGAYIVNWRREGSQWKLHQDVFNAG